MGLRLELKKKSKMNLQKLFLVFVIHFCYNYSIAQEYNVPHKNYEEGELLVPKDLNLQDFNLYPFERYLLSTDTFGEYKQIKNSSKLYQYLVNIDMINGYAILGLRASDFLSKKEYFEMFPKNSNSLYLQKYPISKKFNCYLLKIIFNPKDEEDREWSLEQLFFLNVKGSNITNISLLSSTSKGGFGGSQDYTINMGRHFYYTGDVLYSDVIIIDDDRILEKPLYQKFKFDEKGHLKIIDKKN